MATTTALICGECGVGNYAQVLEMFPVYTCTNAACGHSVDINLDIFPYLEEDEDIAISGGVLSTVSGWGE